MASATGGARRRAPPERAVQAMFDDVAERYDFVNGVLSLGLDSCWRRRTATAARAPTGGLVLDLGAGTGELSVEVARRARRVVAFDVSHAMLLRARSRLGRRGFVVRGSAFRLPFRDGVFDSLVSGFVLRNLEDLPRAFEETGRVVRGGGTVALVDITEPRSRLLRRGFDAYFGTVAPALGRLVGKADAYRYLVRSLAQLPPSEELAELLARAGFDRVSARPLTGGMVTLFTGTRVPHAASGAAR